MATLALTNTTDLPPDLTRAVSRLESVWHSDKDKERRQHCKSRMRVYHGDCAWLIRPMPDETEASFKTKPKFTPPLLGLAIGQLSYLYDDSPKRESESETEQATWDAHVWDFATGTTGELAKADPLIRLCGHVNLMPRTVTTDQAWGVETVRYTPDQCAAVKSSADPLVADALAIAVGSTTVDDTSFTVFQVWTPDYVCTVHGSDVGTWEIVSSVGPNGTTARVHPNPYGEIPVIELREEEADGEYWGRPWGGRDLLRNLRTVYELGTEYVHTSRLQRGQPVIEGSTKAPTGAMGPDSIIIAPDGSTFKIIGNAADLAGMREALVTLLEVLAKTLGLPSRTFRLDDRAARSGVAIHLDRAELSDDRKGRVTKARDWEAAYHRVVAKVLQVDRAVTLDASLVKTNFGSWGDGESLDQRRNRVQAEVSQGLLGRVDAVLELHPEMDRDQALERVREAGVTPDTMALVRDLLGQVQSGAMSPALAVVLVLLRAPEVDPAMLLKLFELAAKEAELKASSSAPEPAEVEPDADVEEDDEESQTDEEPAGGAGSDNNQGEAVEHNTHDAASP